MKKFIVIAETTDSSVREIS